jgi:hypothetical protein
MDDILTWKDIVTTIAQYPVLGDLTLKGSAFTPACTVHIGTEYLDITISQMKTICEAV